MIKSKKFILLILSAFALTSCAELIQLLDMMKMESMKEPEVSVTAARIKSLSFRKIDMEFDINVNNSNKAAVRFHGFDYNLNIDDVSLISGDQNESVEIPARGSQTIKFPASISYSDIFKLSQNISSNDSINYRMDFGLKFNIPVLGEKRLPISKSGTLPILKLPRISISSIKLDKLSFSGADLNLRIKIDNPNMFKMMIKKLNYQMTVNGRQWISGINSKIIDISGKDDTFIDVPVSLNLLEMGQSVMQILQGDNAFDYQFSGDVDFAETIDLLDAFNLPFDKSGQLKLIK